MNYVERITARPTMEGGEGLLATIIRRVMGYQLGVSFPSKSSDQLQVGLLSHHAGHAVKPHRHPPQMRTIVGTEEALIVMSGSVTLTLYNSAGIEEAVRRLGPGDIAVLHGGGHGLYVDEDSEIVEIKQGPYYGALIDKVLIEPKSISSPGFGTTMPCSCGE